MILILCFCGQISHIIGLALAQEDLNLKSACTALFGSIIFTTWKIVSNNA